MPNTSTVDVDLTCIGCGYNLRTLPWEGRCPECTRPVQESVGGWGPVLTSQVALRALRRGIAFYVAASLFATLVEIAFRIVTLYCMELNPTGWYRFFLYRWFDGSVLANALVAISTIFILVACTPQPTTRYRMLAWGAIPFAIVDSVINVVWLIGVHLKHPQVQSIAQALSSNLLSALSTMIVALVMWFLLRSVIPSKRYSWLRPLCLLAMVPSIIGLVLVAFEFNASRYMGSAAYGVSWIAEWVTIFQLFVLWAFERRLGRSKDHRSLAHAVEPMEGAPV